MKRQYSIYKNKHVFRFMSHSQKEEYIASIKSIVRIEKALMYDYGVQSQDDFFKLFESVSLYKNSEFVFGTQESGELFQDVMTEIKQRLFNDLFLPEGYVDAVSFVEKNEQIASALSDKSDAMKLQLKMTSSFFNVFERELENKHVLVCKQVEEEKQKLEKSLMEMTEAWNEFFELQRLKPVDKRAYYAAVLPLSEAYVLAMSRMREIELEALAPATAPIPAPATVTAEALTEAATKLAI